MGWHGELIVFRRGSHARPLHFVSAASFRLIGWPRVKL